MDPYIILLVRDPRGIFNSRAKIFTSEQYIQQGRGRNYDELAHNIQTLCNQTQTMLDDIGRWPDLRAKTLTVRYEDLASNPLKQDGECTEIHRIVVTMVPSKLRKSLISQNQSINLSGFSFLIT